MDDDERNLAVQQQSLTRLMQEWDELEDWLISFGQNGQDQLQVQEVLDKIHSIRPF